MPPNAPSGTAVYHPAVHPISARRGAGIVLLAAVAAHATRPVPGTDRRRCGPDHAALERPPSVGPTTGPSPTIVAPAEFPLAVVTGLQTTKSVIELDEITAIAAEGALVVPCGIAVAEPALTVTRACVAADDTASAIQDDQDLIALLPPGLVEPATKVLPIAGDSPYGLFGADLFGDPEARALPYPIVGTATREAALDPAWLVLDASRVWTMTSIGSLCSDRYGAREAVTKGKGWDWVFGGGTAEYKRPPRLNPNPRRGSIGTSSWSRSRLATPAWSGRSSGAPMSPSPTMNARSCRPRTGARTASAGCRSPCRRR